MAGTWPCFEDLEVGSAAPERRYVLSRTDFVRYAGASGDFNPLHHDEPAAQAVGMPSVFGHGMLSMGLLASAVEAWLGPATLVEMAARFTRSTWPGETVVAHAVVTGTRVEGRRRLVDLDCRLSSADGEAKVVARAVARVSERP
jgi:acyl dehydratase